MLLCFQNKYNDAAYHAWMIGNNKLSRLDQPHHLKI